MMSIMLAFEQPIFDTGSVNTTMPESNGTNIPEIGNILIKQDSLFLTEDVVPYSLFLESSILEIDIVDLPIATWDKNRYNIDKWQDGFRVYDPNTNQAYRDHDLIVCNLGENLPYGEKRLVFNLEIDPSIVTGWGNKIFQLSLDGAELKPVGFALEKGSDGKGFVPLVKGKLEFIIPKEKTHAGVLAFMTTTGTNYNFKIKNIHILYKEEQGPRKEQLTINLNQLGYVNDLSKTALIGFSIEIAEPINFKIVDDKNDVVFEGVSEFNRFSDKSGQYVAVLNFSDFNKLGSFKIVIPKQAKIEKEISAEIEINVNLFSQYKKLRDSALFAFNWFTSGPLGPYKTDEKAQESALFTIDHETRKVKYFENPEEIVDLKEDFGWNDAGDYNKYTVTGAYSTGLMMLTSKFADFSYDVGVVPRDNEKRPDYLSLTKHELDFLLKLQREDGACSHKLASAKWAPKNLAPEEDFQEKFIMPITTTATANFSATMALAYTKFKDSKLEEDREKAELYLLSAKKAWGFLKFNSDIIEAKSNYGGESYGGPYLDNNDKDERLWAAVELFSATDDDQYHNYIKENLPKFLSEENMQNKIMDWQNVGFLAIFSYLKTNNPDADLLKLIKDNLIEYADNILEKQGQNPYNIAFAGDMKIFDWASNAIIASTALKLMFIYKETNTEKYKIGALKILDYLLGKNPNNISYITGFGSYSAKDPHFRPYMSGKWELPNGLLVGGPNSFFHAGDTMAIARKHLPPMLIYVDHQDSFSTNEVAINWQATLSSLMAMILD